MKGYVDTEKLGVRVVYIWDDVYPTTLLSKYIDIKISLVRGGYTREPTWS